MWFKKPKISVVIPAYNEATYIDRLLEALTGQSYGNFEVIVSDAQSKDGTKEVVEGFKDKLDIKFMEAPPKGPAYGRNQGAKHARGQWLLFLDADDDIDDPDFVKTLLAETEKNGWQTSTTKMAARDMKLLERIGFSINYRYIKFLSHTKKPVAQGYCIFTKKSMFEKLGGFNEAIQFGEDYDYVTRAAKKGFGITEKTYYYVDLRRFHSEGFLWAARTVLNEIQRQLPGNNLEKNRLKYEFGKHEKRK